MRLFNEIAKRAVAFLLLAVMTFGAITYSLGYYEFSFIDRGDSPFDDITTQEILGTLLPGTDISDFTGDITTLPLPPESSSVITDPGTMPPVTTAPDITTDGITSSDVTTSGGTNPPVPVTKFDTLDSYINAGYKVTWANYDSAMKVAEVVLDAGSLDRYTLGNSQRVYVRMKMNYGEAHREIVYYTTKKTERPTADVYMGFIITDAGKGKVNSGIGSKVYNDAERVNIYTSVGKLIGTYPSEEVIPANCRDRKDRALFIYNKSYYYLNTETKRFELSDYIPERDSRGLEFDYNPDFGKSDNKYNIYSDVQTVTETFEIKNTGSYYTRYGIDSRLAEQIYLYYPEFADQIANTFNKNGILRYYNRLFRETLKDVIKGVENGSITRPPETTKAPETTADPETTVAPDTETPPDVTTVPDVTTAPDAVTSDVITTEATAAPEVTTHVITEATTVTPPQARTIIYESEELNNIGIPVKLTLDISYDAYRFIYRASQPKVDLTKETTKTYKHNSEFINHTISWKGDFKYAKAFNFSENRAYTVDDTGIVTIINTSGGKAVSLDKVRLADSDEGGYYRHQFYTEPYERDEYMLGHYYFNDGLIRMRIVETLTYKINEYEKDYEVIVNTSGKEVNAVPEGYRVVSYSDSIFLVERNGRYGYYHRDGYWVAQPIYTYAAPFIEGMAVLGYSDGVKGAIDTSGSIVIPFEYSEISNASSGIFAAYSEAEGWKILAKVSK